MKASEMKSLADKCVAEKEAAILDCEAQKTRMMTIMENYKSDNDKNLAAKVEEVKTLKRKLENLESEQNSRVGGFLLFIHLGITSVSSVSPSFCPSHFLCWLASADDKYSLELLVDGFHCILLCVINIKTRYFQHIFMWLGSHPMGLCALRWALALIAIICRFWSKLLWQFYSDNYKTLHC